MSLFLRTPALDKALVKATKSKIRHGSRLAHTNADRSSNNGHVFPSVPVVELQNWMRHEDVSIWFSNLGVAQLKWERKYLRLKIREEGKVRGN